MQNVYDFGAKQVPATKDDVFFLDSSFIIAYLIEDDIFHHACANFLMYLQCVRDSSLCISEITVKEVMFVLAKTFFRQNEIKKFKTDHQREPTSSERNKLHSKWNYIIKEDREHLTCCNQMAARVFRPFLDFVHLIPSSHSHIRNSINLMCYTPMISGDALITTSALQHKCSGIVTTDSDFISASEEIPIYHTSIQNQSYDIDFMVKELQTIGIWLEALGRQGFEDKFNIKPFADHLS